MEAKIMERTSNRPTFLDSLTSDHDMVAIGIMVPKIPRHCLALFVGLVTFLLPPLAVFFTEPGRVCNLLKVPTCRGLHTQNLP
jgi:hypothetical protein